MLRSKFRRMSVYNWIFIFYLSYLCNANDDTHGIQKVIHKRQFPNGPVVVQPVLQPTPQPIYNPSPPVLVQEPVYNPPSQPVVVEQPVYNPPPQSVPVQQPVYNPPYQPVVAEQPVYNPPTQTVVVQQPVYNPAPVYTPPVEYTQPQAGYEPNVRRIIVQQEVRQPTIIDVNTPYEDGYYYQERPRTIVMPYDPRAGVLPYESQRSVVVPVPRPFRYLQRRVNTTQGNKEDPSEANLPTYEEPMRVTYLNPSKNAVKEVTAPPPLVIPAPEYEPIVDPIQADYDLPGQAGMIWDPWAQAFVPRRVAPRTRVVIRQPIVIYEPILNPNATLGWDEYPPNIQAQKEADEKENKEDKEDSENNENKPNEADLPSAKAAAKEAVAEATEGKRRT